MPYQKITVVDLEATCWEPQEQHGKVSEIIEIGAVSCDLSSGILGTDYTTFVRPILFPELSAFCTQLTTIASKHVSQAPLFPVAMNEFQSWAFGCSSDPVLASWGDYDRKHLITSSRWYGIPIRFRHHINLKDAFFKLRGDKRPVGMRKALQLAGLPLVGTHHRGVDDARNIATIIHWMVTVWGVDSVLSFAKDIDPNEGQSGEPVTIAVNGCSEYAGMTPDQAIPLAVQKACK